MSARHCQYNPCAHREEKDGLCSEHLAIVQKHLTTNHSSFPAGQCEWKECKLIGWFHGTGSDEVDRLYCAHHAVEFARQREWILSKVEGGTKTHTWTDVERRFDRIERTLIVMNALMFNQMGKYSKEEQRSKAKRLSADIRDMMAEQKEKFGVEPVTPEGPTQ